MTGLHTPKSSQTPPTGRLVTRFAPSPTGYLHLGHVLSALYVHGIGRALGAKILLRIEDHDRGRCRPEFEKAIFEDLAWLGFDYDNAAGLAPDRPSPFRQNDCAEIYQTTAADL